MVSVVIVDDSRLMRRMLRGALESDPRIRVIGEGADPYEARDVIRATNPDVVTLDVEMPRMDGLEFLRLIMKLRPTPVIMVAGGTVEGAETTLAALELGAVDAIAKPSGRDGWSAFAAAICEKVRVAARARLRPPPAAPSAAPSAASHAPARDPSRGVSQGNFQGEPHRDHQGNSHGNPLRNHQSTPQGTPHTPARDTPGAALGAASGTASGLASGAASAPHPAPPRPRHPVAPARCDLIAIGASTGGVNAIHRLLGGLPATLPPIVIAQHMPPTFTSRFAARLGAATGLDAAEAAEGDRLRPGMLRIAPGDRHLRIENRGGELLCRLSDAPPVAGHRPSVDVLFASAAEAAGPRALGIILTGMGRDGARGLRRMRDAGAGTLGEAQSSCTVYGMPKAALELGAVAEELALADLSARLRALARLPAALSRTG